jgi:hypothetical protein
MMSMIIVWPPAKSEQLGVASLIKPGRPAPRRLAAVSVAVDLDGDGAHPGRHRVGQHCHPSGATSRPGAHAGRLMGDRQSKQIVGRRQRDRRPERTQFECAGAEAIDKIFVRRLGIVGGLDSGRVLAARETSAPSQPAPPKMAPPMAWDEAADAYF